MDESTTRMLLTRVLAEAPPPAPVDLDRVAELAEARRRYRARSMIAAAAAAVVVVTVTIAALTGGVDTERAAPPAGQPVQRPVPAPAERPVNQAPVENGLPPTAPKQFDPARSSLTVSGIPDSMTERGTAIRTTDLVVYASSAKPWSFVQIAVGAAGHDLSRFLLNRPAASTTGPVIHGHASKWYHLGDGDYALYWQWAEDAWAIVTVQDVKDPEKFAERIALSMDVDLTGRTTLPYSVTEPKGYTLAEFQTTSSATLSPAATVAFAGPASTFVSVTANLLGNGIGAPTGTYQDRPVRITQQGNYTTVVMATGGIKVTGTCNWNPKAEFTAADFQELCRATTASVEQYADLRSPPRDWPVYGAK